MKTSSQAEILGLAGLFPFLGLPIFILLGSLSLYEGLTFFAQYSAIILSFLGGVLWFEGIANKKAIWQLYAAMLPSLIGWFALVIMPPKISIVVLMASFLILLTFEYKFLKSELWYIKLRTRLTTVAFGGHLMMIWLVFS